MSEEQLKGFLEKIKGDTSLQEKLKAEGADPVAIAKAGWFYNQTTGSLAPRFVRRRTGRRGWR